MEAITDRQTDKTNKEYMLIGWINLHPNFETFILNRSRENNDFPRNVSDRWPMDIWNQR